MDLEKLIEIITKIYVEDKKEKKKRETNKKTNKSSIKLAEYIKKTGMTKAEFARRLNVSYSSVQNWTTNKKKPNKNQATQIEKFTNGEVKISDLLSQEGWNKKDKT